MAALTPYDRLPDGTYEAMTADAAGPLGEQAPARIALEERGAHHVHVSIARPGGSVDVLAMALPHEDPEAPSVVYVDDTDLVRGGGG